MFELVMLTTMTVFQVAGPPLKNPLPGGVLTVPILDCTTFAEVIQTDEKNLFSFTPRTRAGRAAAFLDCVESELLGVQRSNRNSAWKLKADRDAFDMIEARVSCAGILNPRGVSIPDRVPKTVGVFVVGFCDDGVVRWVEKKP